MAFDARADRQFRDEPELVVDLRAEFLRQLIADAGTGKSEFDDDLRGIANDLGGRDRAGGDAAATDQWMDVSVEGGQQGFTGSGHRKTFGKNGEIGKASWRGRVGQGVWIWGVAGECKKKISKEYYKQN